MEVPAAGEIHYRPATEEDFPFILKSWIRCGLACKQFAGLDREACAEAVKQTILKLKERGAAITIACNPANTSEISGFVCYESHKDWPIIHFVYVKELFRGMGLGASLVAIGRGSRTGQVRYTFKNRHTVKILREGLYRPFLVRNAS